MKRILLAVSLCALVLSGCDTMRGWFGMPTNDKPIVSVTNGQVSVSPDPLEFPGDRQAVVIVWSLDEAAVNAGFTFAGARKGVKIERQVDGIPKDIAREFDQDMVIGNGKKYQLRNRNTGAGKYKYSITVVAPGGRELPPLDPFIVNDR